MASPPLHVRMGFPLPATVWETMRGDDESPQARRYMFGQTVLLQVRIYFHMPGITFGRLGGGDEFLQARRYSVEQVRRYMLNLNVWETMGEASRPLATC